MELWTLVLVLVLISSSHQLSWDIGNNVDSKGFTTLSLYTSGLEYDTRFFRAEERPRKIKDGNIVVWNGKLRKRCTGYVVNYKDGVPVLLKLFTKGPSAAILVRYYAKVDGMGNENNGSGSCKSLKASELWKEIEREEYIARIREMCELEDPENFVLDIGSEDASHFDITESTTGDLNTRRYTLVTGASVRKIFDGNHLILELAKGEECHRVSVDHDNGSVKLISVLIVNPFDIGRRIYLKVRGENVKTINRRYYLSWLHSRAMRSFQDDSCPGINGMGKSFPNNGMNEACPDNGISESCHNIHESDKVLTLNVLDVDLKEFYIRRIGNRRKSHRKCIPKSGFIARVFESRKELWRAKPGEKCHAAILVFKARKLVRFTLHVRDPNGKEMAISFSRNEELWRAQKQYQEEE